MFWEYLIQSARELKQRKGILAQPSQKKGKGMAQETIDLVQAFYKDDEYSRQLPGKKDYVSRVWARNFQSGSLDTNWEFLSFGAGGVGDLLWRLPMGFGVKPQKVFATWHL